MKLKQKAAKLEKMNLPGKKNKIKVKRGDHKDYVKWFHDQKFSCIECTSRQTEAHHIVPSDDRTIVPICPYHHRGAYFIKDNKEHEKGFYLHRGTRSKEFREKFPDKKLMQLAKGLYKDYQNDI
jgi:hypothetical protein